MTLDKAALEGLRIERRDDEPGERPRWVVPVVIVVLLAAAAGVWAFTGGRGKEVRVAPAVAAATGTARGAVLNASGYVTARRQATVSSKVTGKIAEVYIEEGMTVKAGQELARLDEAYAAKSLNLSEAEAAASASALEETRVRIREAQLDYDRASRLASQQISSRADLDRAQAQVDALRARLASQQDSLNVARSQVQIQRQNVEDTIIRAPFNGIVVSKDAQPGEMISPVSAGGGFTRTGICTIVDMESLEIEVDVSEAYINRVHQGQPVEAVLDAYPEWKIPAHVITAVPTADRQKATVKVRIAFDQKDVRILPDMGVKVTFISTEPVSQASAAVEVPKTAIRREGEIDIVFVVKNGRAERRAVKVASTSGDTAKVSTGISGGESVVIDGAPDLKDGDAVKVKEEKGQ
ncbi:MAG TPA: efflux RND transporter periplasmic adaptor subunit [Thermoanaerobaculia bacterium]|jgi:RND family efflux transporter MFP subunit